MCFMLQGAFGGLLANLFNKNIGVNILSSVVFVFTPIMIERAFRHCALTAHFLILSALYYYFKNKGRTDFKATIPFFIINALAITIHPYFLPFTFGIMFAFCIENFLLHKKYVSSMGYILMSIASTLFVGYVIGAFYTPGSLSNIGYGTFNMNLNALHNPISNGFSNWSSVLEIKPHVILFQIEGFNYLGLGIIVFVFISTLLYLLSCKKDIFKVTFNFIKNNFGIIFSTTALLVFAVGDWLSFGGLRFFHIPFPQDWIDGIFGIFRANGRFGWLLVYSIVIFVIFNLSKIKNNKLAVALISVLLFIQIFDMRGVLASKNAYFTSKDGDLQAQVYHSVLKNSFWDDLSEKYEVCTHVKTNIPNSNIEMAVKFGKNNHASNSGFEARVDERKAWQLHSDVYKRVANGTLADNEVIIADWIPTDGTYDNIVKNNYSAFCVEGDYIICNNKFTEAELQQYMAEGNFEIIHLS